MIRRKPILPKSAVERLDLAPGDEPLGFAETDHGWAVATKRGFHVIGGADEPVLTIPWHDVDSFGMEPETDTLRVRLVDGSGKKVPLVAGGSSRFAAILREQVNHSIVHIEYADEPGVPVRVVVRRDADGQFFVQAIGDGVDPDDPRHAAATKAAQDRAWEAVGRPSSW